MPLHFLFKPTRRNSTKEQIKMLAFSGLHRKPLQPKNQYASTATNQAPRISLSNKENVPPLYSSVPVKKLELKEIPFSNEENIAPSPLYSTTPVKKEIDDDDDDALLAEKLKTEKVLREKGEMLDLEMKEMVKRGEIQKQLELEVDRLYRLKEINLACMTASRLRSLRDKEEEKKNGRGINSIYRSASSLLHTHPN